MMFNEYWEKLSPVCDCFFKKVISNQAFSLDCWLSCRFHALFGFSKEWYTQLCIFTIPFSFSDSSLTICLSLCQEHHGIDPIRLGAVSGQDWMTVMLQPTLSSTSSLHSSRCFPVHSLIFLIQSIRLLPVGLLPLIFSISTALRILLWLVMWPMHAAFLDLTMAMLFLLVLVICTTSGLVSFAVYGIHNIILYAHISNAFNLLIASFDNVHASAP